MYICIIHSSGQSVTVLSRLNRRGAGSVDCLWPNVATVYRPRQPRASPLYRTIERYLPEFERCYDKRYANRYGPWRPIISDAARRFLRCGDLHFGFARVRCPDCAHEMFVPFSCRLRCLCPSCHQKRTLLSSQTIAQTICAPVPHRQLVFTIPKRLRIYCRYDRTMLGHLARAAWQATVEVYGQSLDRPESNTFRDRPSSTFRAARLESARLGTGQAILILNDFGISGLDFSKRLLVLKNCRLPVVHG